MSRETYFRAWDIEAKCYVQEPILVDNFGQVYVVCEEASKEEGTCLIKHKPNVILEQDTGLKDKNGKEICEGDIVKLTGEVAKNKSTIYKVVRDSFLTGFDLISLEQNKSDIGYLNKTEMENRYEVIGNVHENKELLDD